MSGCNDRAWFNTELTPHQAEMFRIFLTKSGLNKCKGFRMESSEAFNLIHFELCLTDEEVELINSYLEEV